MISPVVSFWRNYQAIIIIVLCLILIAGGYVINPAVTTIILLIVLGVFGVLLDINKGSKDK